MTKISEMFGISRSQNELDFVDIDISTDKQLFVDPYQLSKYSSPFAIEANKRINSFFTYLIELLIAKKYDKAFEIFSHVGEINETCLGMSKGKPTGRGIGQKNTEAIFKELIKSDAVKLKQMNSLEDLRLFVRGVDRDKISDMTSNIIKDLLIEYTQQQCELHNITLTPNTPSGLYWDYKTRSWRNCFTDMLVIEGKKYLLVPKLAVSYSNRYSSGVLYNEFSLTYLQEENIRNKTSLVQFRKEKNGYKEPFVTKKSIKKVHEEEIKKDELKDWLSNFIDANPKVFSNFKNETYKKEKNVNWEEDRAKIAKYLIDELQKIQKGSEEASKYHNTIICILEFIFFPHICNPSKECEIHEGRKRIDIVYDNSSQKGFFFDLMAKFNIPANFIIVECKNYSKNVNNPELDQLSGRFSIRRGQFGLMLCRDVDDMKILLKRCSDTYYDDRGLIIPLVDEDLIKILKDISNNIKNDGLSLLVERYKAICFKQ